MLLKILVLFWALQEADDKMGLCVQAFYLEVLLSEKTERWNLKPGERECWGEASKAAGEPKQGSVKLAPSQIGLGEESPAEGGVHP